MNKNNYQSTKYLIVNAYTPPHGGHVYVAQNNSTTIVFSSSTFYYKGETIVLPYKVIKGLEAWDEECKVLSIAASKGTVYG